MLSVTTTPQISRYLDLVAQRFSLPICERGIIILSP